MRIAVEQELKSLPHNLIVPIAQNQPNAPVFERIAQWTTLSPEEIQQDFTAEAGEVQLLYAKQGKIFLLGLGNEPDAAAILKAFRSFSYKQKKKLSSEVGILFSDTTLKLPLVRQVEASLNGFVLGTYQIGQFKTEEVEKHPLTTDDCTLTIFASANATELLAAARRGEATAETQMSIFDLVNAPSNKKTPQHLAEWALASGKAYGYRVEVWDKKQIEEVGLHALLAVNRGSEYPPAFIIMEYRPTAAAEGIPKVGLVGKGVTFDTGGLSIKPSTNMHYMKSDMGGAAAVFGTIELAAKLQLPVHLIGVVPSTDNSVDALSIKPSDVINSYSGKTIEVIDTDAEGRLILADGLNYMVRHFQPEVLINLATLTGSAVRTFGYHAAALFSNNDELTAALTKAANATGERLWAMPMWDVYKDDIKSDVADVRNFSGKPVAGAIGAAKFLEAFINNHSNWAHFDIAGVAFTDSEFASQKSATAYGVRLLIEYLSNLATEK